jgi:hypothetical protein
MQLAPHAACQLYVRKLTACNNVDMLLHHTADRDQFNKADKHPTQLN